MKESADLFVLLTPQEMAIADRLTIERGTPGYDLMKRAGATIFDALNRDFPAGSKVTIACGPGNNGGDGFVVARLLKDAGYDVHVGLLGDSSALKGDALLAYQDWTGPTYPLANLSLDECDLIIDALFGAGLSRALSGEAAVAVEAMNAARAEVWSVDLPSGIDGRTGAALGPHVIANQTITFFRKKPGHLLLPGRNACGRVHVTDIGISDDILMEIGCQLFENDPKLWLDLFPGFSADMHKYTRGHALVLSGGEFQTGASRLTAKAALRTGAGLVTIAGPTASLRIHAAHLTAVMLKEMEDKDDLATLLTDDRISSVALGPALGTDHNAKNIVFTCLQSDKSLVLDADALTLMSRDKDTTKALIAKAGTTPVLTPHEGEFKRLYPTRSDNSKVERARHAAKDMNSVIVLKGADTVIASPDGRAAINANAPPWLATAGSGDTLTGIIAGLRAQGMPAFEAACGGVWLHGQAAQIVGPYLTADDLELGLRTALKDLTERSINDPPSGPTAQQ